MTTISKLASKAELAREILTTDSWHTLDEVKRVLNKLISKSFETDAPCCYTLKDARERMAITDEDADAGIGLSEEEVEQRIKKLI